MISLPDGTLSPYPLICSLSIKLLLDHQDSAQLGVMAHTGNPSYSGGEGCEYWFKASPKEKS
jgi:hypothetical protein